VGYYGTTMVHAAHKVSGNCFGHCPRGMPRIGHSSHRIELSTRDNDAQLANERDHSITRSFTFRHQGAALAMLQGRKG
jgi:hypothetical protein